VAGNVLALYRSLVPPALSAVCLVVGVEDAGILPRGRYADAVARPVHRGEVAHHHQSAALFVPAHEGHGVGLVVVGLNPREALPGEIQLPQLFVLQVEGVGRLEKGLGLPVFLVGQQVPVQGLLKMPLVPLAELAAHHQQLLPRVGEHVGVKRPHAGKLLGIGPRHLVEKRALHMHHLVMGEG